jgi:hypothetical protein
MGHEPVVMHWYPRDLEKLYWRRVPHEQIRCQSRFAKTFFPLSRLCRNEQQLVEEMDRLQLDLLMTGSDSLFKYVPLCDRSSSFSWRSLRFVNNYVSSDVLDGNPFFCSYYEKLHRKIPVVAFSVSSQNCCYYKMTTAEREQMKKYLSHYQEITVRDEWTRLMVQDITGHRDVCLTPDPVFSFRQNCNGLIPKSEDVRKQWHIPGHYVLLSFSDDAVPEEYVLSLAALLQERGKTPVYLPEPENKKDYGLEHVIRFPVSPLEWYALIAHADAYVGTRMHPILVCLHEGVPFFSFDGNGIADAEDGAFLAKSSKVFDVLQRAGLENYIFLLKSGRELPSAATVLSQVLSFDVSRCLSFSSLMQDRYVEAMKRVMSRNKNC